MALTKTQDNNEKQIKILEKDNNCAELIGLILGDGNICSYTKGKNVSTHHLEITLDSRQLPILENTVELLEKVFEEEPSVLDAKGNTKRVYLRGKQVVIELQKLGLKIGDKKKNQVRVPKWIRNDREYSLKCLKGLIDSDGSVYLDNRDNRSYKRIAFKNTSQPLLDDFIKLCEYNDLRAYHGGKNQVQVSMKDIEKFIDKVRPIKNSLLSAN